MKQQEAKQSPLEQLAELLKTRGHAVFLPAYSPLNRSDSKRVEIDPRFPDLWIEPDRNPEKRLVAILNENLRPSTLSDFSSSEWNDIVGVIGKETASPRHPRYISLPNGRVARVERYCFWLFPWTHSNALLLRMSLNRNAYVSRSRNATDRLPAEIVFCKEFFTEEDVRRIRRRTEEQLRREAYANPAAIIRTAALKQISLH